MHRRLRMTAARNGRRFAALATACALLLSPGCSAGKPDPIGLRANNSYYQQSLQRVTHTAMHAGAADALVMSTPSEAPKTVRDRTEDVPWELALGEAVQLALQNNPLIRQNAQFLSPGNPVFAGSEQAPSIFDLAIQANEVQFGQRGIEAALSDYNPQLTTNMTWGRDERITNNNFQNGGIAPGDAQIEDTANFASRLEQLIPTGGTIALVHNWDYSQNNQPNRLFPSLYEGVAQMEFRQPLWAGAGVEFTQIAGPLSSQNRSTRLNQGIRLAQVNQKISAVDFYLAVNNLVKDVNDAYWQLYQSFQEYGAELAVRDAAEQVWREVAAHSDAQGAAVEAQAEATYLESRARTEQALAQVYENETRLRRLLGLPVNDGRLLRPNPLPVTTEVLADWHGAVSDAFMNRRELHRQKLVIQSLEWQFQAARSLINPRLDLVANYRVNGFGDRLMNRTRGDDGQVQADEQLRSAYGQLLEGHTTGWSMGLNFSVPLGLQAERAQVQNIELRLAKARVALATQEQEIQHELSIAFQNLARWHQLSQTQETRRKAVEKQVEALDAEYKAGRAERSTVDLLLRARLSLAQAIIEHTRAIVSYNIALADIEYRKGMLLNIYNVSVTPLVAEN